MRYWGARSQPHASVSCRAIHSAVGCAVAAVHKTRRRMLQDKKAEEQAKGNGRDDEEIHRGNAVGMITQEGLPALRRRSPPPRHILRHARLPDIDTELEELAMDPRSTPEWVGQSHLADQ